MSLFALFNRPSVEDQMKAYDLKRRLLDTVSRTGAIDIMIQTMPDGPKRNELIEQRSEIGMFRLNHGLSLDLPPKRSKSIKKKPPTKP